MGIEGETEIDKQRIAQQNELARSWRAMAQQSDGNVLITGADLMNIAVVFGLEVPEPVRGSMRVDGYRTHLRADSLRRVTKKQFEDLGRSQIEFLTKLRDYSVSLKEQNR